VLNKVLWWVLKLLSLNTFCMAIVGITESSVQLASSAVANGFWQHGLQIALISQFNMIMSSMSVFGANVQTTHFDIMSLLVKNTTDGITTYKEHSEMPTRRQPLPNFCRAMFSKESTCFNRFPVSEATSLNPTSYGTCKSAW